MTQSRKFDVKTIVAIGLMAALVFAASKISIDIPTPLGMTRLHLGNVMCILSGLLLGGLNGGLSAGIGSMFFDLFDPRYISSAPFTLVFKFFIGFISGKIAYGNNAHANKLGRNIIGAVSGSVAYVILYLSKSFLTSVLFNKVEIQTALIDVLNKGVVSLTNGIIAVIVAVPLGFAIKKALDKTNTSLVK